MNEVSSAPRLGGLVGDFDADFTAAYDARIAKFPDEGHERRLAYVQGYIDGWNAKHERESVETDG
jgi:hypothetical protein